MCTGCRRWCGSGDKAVSYSPRLVLFGLPCFIVLQRGVKSLAARHQGLEDGRALWAAGGGQGDGAGRDQQSEQVSAKKSSCCLRGLTLSQCCSRKGSWLVYYTVAGSLCYTAAGFGKSHKMLGVCQLMN